MDEAARKDNIAKANRGRKLEDCIKCLLNKLKACAVIEDFVGHPEYPEGCPCFRPDFEVRMGNKIIIIDVTTTARTDREKGKLWDAFWSKKVLLLARCEKRVEALTIVGDPCGNQRERENYMNLKAYIEKCSKPYGAVDEVMTVSEFLRYLLNSGSTHCTYASIVGRCETLCSGFLCTQ